MPERDLFDGEPVEPVEPLRAVRLAAGAAMLDAANRAEQRRAELWSDQQREFALIEAFQSARSGSDRRAADRALAAHRLAMWGSAYRIFDGDACIYCGFEVSSQGADFSPPLAYASVSPLNGPFVRYPACASCASSLLACPDDCLQQRAGWLVDVNSGFNPPLARSLRDRMLTGAFAAVCECGVCPTVRAAKVFRSSR